MDINPAFLGADQRPHQPGADRQPIGTDEDLALGTLDRTLREVVLGAKQTSTVASVTAAEVGKVSGSTPKEYN